MSNKGSYVLKLATGRKFRFRTKELFADAQEALSMNKFANIAAMTERLKQCPTGFEFAVPVIEKKTAKGKHTKNFNPIDFDD